TTNCTEESTPLPVQENCSTLNGKCKSNCNETEIKIDAECGFLTVCCNPKSANITEENLTNDEAKFLIYPKAIESVALFSTKPSYSFSVKNLGENNLKNFVLKYNSNLFSISPGGNISIEGNSSSNFNLTVLNNSKPIREVVVVETRGKKQYLLVKIEFTTQAENISTRYLREQNNLSSTYYCSELSGVVCSAGEVCGGNIVESIEKNCCIGQCAEQKKSSRAWIGYLIGAIGIIILIIIYVKYRKVKPETNPLKKSSLEMGKI
ncbi:TPA: hypothetical protein H1005_00370, partial [archaeon]|nr:hypothetical protein [Candidatus Naiadarchaeales archaeon SRR2090153.bin1042]